jgi:signal transduction histidine kinase
MAESRVMITATVKIEVDLDTWKMAYGTGTRFDAVRDATEHVPATVRHAVREALHRQGNGSTLADVSRVSVSRPY